MDVTKEVISSFALQIEHYERLKNAHVRIRRSVLGEIKEKKDGGLTPPAAETISFLSSSRFAMPSE